MRYHRVAKISTRVFIGISALLYVAFTFCDIFLQQGKDFSSWNLRFLSSFQDLSFLSSCLKFSSICLCLLIAIILCICNSKNKDRYILIVAFMFTVTSDIFLLFTDDFVYGVLSFCVVQTIYLYRVSRIKRITKGKEIARIKGITLLLHIGIRFGVSVGIVIVLSVFRVIIDPLLCITVFYFISFMDNIGLLVVIWNKKLHGQSESNVEEVDDEEDNNVEVTRFLIGMILFILCDISVGLYNITAYIDLSGSAYQVVETIASFGMWGFYLPGQVCIVLSSKSE